MEIPNLFPPVEEALSPTQLAGEITRKLKEIGSGVVEGEVTGLRASTAGHRYFTLADEATGIGCTCFKGIWSDAYHHPVDGQRVRVAFSRVDYYGPHQKASLMVSDIMPVGTGDILQKIEATKDLLRREGVKNHLPLPRFPRLVGLITGNQAAATSDVVEGVRARFPKTRFAFRSATVQGIKCVPEVIDRMIELSSHPLIDVIVIARGGGSIEDLAAFSDERLCRAIASLSVPVVVAIGHEDDVPACYITASATAPVPHKIGSVIVPDRKELLGEVDYAANEMQIALEDILARRGDLDILARSLTGRSSLEMEKLKLAERSLRLEREIEDYLSLRRVSLDASRIELRKASEQIPSPSSLDPEAQTLRYHSLLTKRRNRESLERVKRLDSSLSSAALRRAEWAREGLKWRVTLLEARDWLNRGFASVTKSDGSPLRSVNEAGIGETVVIGLADGTITTRVEERKEE